MEGAAQGGCRVSVSGGSQKPSGHCAGEPWCCSPGVTQAHRAIAGLLWGSWEKLHHRELKRRAELVQVPGWFRASVMVRVEMELNHTDTANVQKTVMTINYCWVIF